ncbi:MAG: hypothetical protein KJ666_05375 [Bacteroidetes bacterium]|nr:hypothetical protein [Bacteroidota bacterium]
MPAPITKLLNVESGENACPPKRSAGGVNGKINLHHADIEFVRKFFDI